MSGTVHAFAAEPYSYAEARSIAEQLGVSEPVAVTLVRRGYRTPEQARTFLAADERHSPADFAGMADAVDLVCEALVAGRRIAVHGDFDVDGVCATALIVSTLRRLGADCDWLIPNRLTDGYGLSAANVERLAERGTQLLITVDCGISCPGEVALARRLGMDVLVTDHHQPGASLPDCTILHPQVSGYPFESLCGTAVAWKLACALWEAAEGGSPDAQLDGASGDLPSAAPADLDLVALATVADVVPLVGENRSLVRRGLAELRRGRRIGMRALMAAASCEPERLDEGDLAFRLAPRINAAGRLYRADAGVELFLTEDSSRAEAIAVELGRANSERRATEREVDAGAEAARRELPERLREAPGLVLAGEDWHPGVVGIVASRLVERHHRPVIVLSLDGEGRARGSGRSIPGFDLLAALEACSTHLTSFGGHRAAAGLALPDAEVEAFREAFAAHAASVLSPGDLRRTERIDAMVGGVGLGLELAEEISRLAPFGMGNPGVRLLVPSARVSDVRAMGQEGRHSRFSLHSGSHRALGVAFGRSSLGVDEEEPLDAAVRLEVNHWNGSVEPRVVLRELYPLEGENEAATHGCDCAEAEWWTRFEAERKRPLDELAAAADHLEASTSPGIGSESRNPRRECEASGSATARIAELVSSGAHVLAVCADASRRAALANGSTGLARFNGGAALVACHRCGEAAVAGLAGRSDGGLALTDYATLARRPSLATGFDHVVLVDPPASPAEEAAATAPPTSGGGFLHRLWGEPEIPFARAVLAEQWASREGVAAAFRALRGAGSSGAANLRKALAGPGPNPLCAEAAARRFRVLEELELVHGGPNEGDGVVRVVSSTGTDLQRSGAFRAYSAAHAEAQRFLESPKLP